MKNGIYFCGTWKDDGQEFFVVVGLPDFPNRAERMDHYAMATNLRWELWRHGHLIDTHPFQEGFESIPRETPTLADTTILTFHMA